MNFADMGLCRALLDAVTTKGYDTPSPIQEKAIPVILEGKDVMAAAQTGTGKTAGFTLPILENLRAGKFAGANQARVLILTPTRELAAQVGESVQTYGKNLPLKSAVVFGGVKINPQMQKLRRGVDVLVATPGRLLDLHNQNAVKFDHLEVLVLDEADRMLDMGFIHDIRKIISKLPKKRQNLMFSATFSRDIRELAKTIVHQPVEISVTPENAAAPTVKQWIVPVDKKNKSPLLIHLIKQKNWGQVLVFSRTKHGANKITKQLEAASIRAAAIHGNKSQGARTRALADFKADKVQVLVATDIAARGLDIHQLPQVVNFDLPNVPEDYVHRIGRTGRAGSEGEAVSLVSADELQQLRDIEKLTQKLLVREYEENFYPEHDIPETRLNLSPDRAKKPKKPQPPRPDSQNNRNQRRGGPNPNGTSRNPKSSHKKKRPSRNPQSSGGSQSSANNQGGNKTEADGNTMTGHSGADYWGRSKKNSSDTHSNTRTENRPNKNPPGSSKRKQGDSQINSQKNSQDNSQNNSQNNSRNRNQDDENRGNR